MVVDSNIVRGPDFKSSTFMKEVEETTFDKLIIEAAKRRDNDVFMIEAESMQELSTKEFLQKSYNLAAELQELGCARDTIVGILSESRMEHSIITLGAVLTGAIVAFFNPLDPIDEQRHMFSIAKPAIMFCSVENYNKLQQIAPPSYRVILFDSDNTSVDFTCLKFSQLVQSTKKYTVVENRPDDEVVVHFSSGTTGLRKGVMLTHKNLVFMLKLSEEMNRAESDKIQRIVSVNVTQMHRISGFIVLFWTLLRNMTLVIMRKFELRLYLSMVEKYKVTQIAMPSSFVSLLLENPIVDEYDLSNVKFILCLLTPLKGEIEEALKKKFILNGVQHAYGMTESTTFCTITDIKTSKTGTCGSPVPGVQMKVVHTQTREILGKNEAGEICIKGPNVMKRYYKDEKATAEALGEGGWLHTGDFGYYDEDGDFFLMGRIKELIRYRGSQIAPTELEDLLLTHPCIADCAVIGIPDEEAGELPMACVVKKHSATKVKEDEIIQFVAERISPQKRLWGGVKFVPKIPRSALGKTLRMKSRELWTNDFNPNYEGNA